MEIETEILGAVTPSQNQKTFPLFVKAGRGRGREAKKWGRFLVLDVTGGNVPRRRRSHHHAIGAYDSLSIHQALRACEVGSCKGENVIAEWDFIRSLILRERRDSNITCSVQVVALFSKELATFSNRVTLFARRKKLRPPSPQWTKWTKEKDLLR